MTWTVVATDDLDTLADAFEEWASSQQRVKFETLAVSDATAGLPAVRLIGCDPATDDDRRRRQWAKHRSRLHRGSQ